MGNKNSTNNNDTSMDMNKIKDILSSKNIDKFNKHFSIIRSLANSNQQDEDGLTILNFLCKKPKDDNINQIIIKLLEKCPNMNINTQAKYGSTPLHLCMDNYPILCKLIEYGADIDLKNSREHTPLEAFFRTSTTIDKKCVFTLCDLGANVNDPHMILNICQRWDKDDILEFLEYHPNLDITYCGQTPLSAVIKRFEDDKHFIKNFISKGVNTGTNNQSLLLTLVKENKWNYVDILLENGADPNITNIKGKNVGYYCRDYRDMDKFVYYGYDIVFNGTKLLEHYCSKGEKYHNIMLYLLEHNVVIDEKNYIVRVHPIVREYYLKKTE